MQCKHGVNPFTELGARSSQRTRGEYNVVSRSHSFKLCVGCTTKKKLLTGVIRYENSTVADALVGNHLIDPKPMMILRYGDSTSHGTSCHIAKSLLSLVCCNEVYDFIAPCSRSMAHSPVRSIDPADLNCTSLHC